MSEQPSDAVVDEPIDCEVCGEPLEFKAGDLVVNEAKWAETGEAGHTPLLQRCTNVNCPTRGDGLAPADQHQVIPSYMRHAEEGSGPDGR